MIIKSLTRHYKQLIKNNCPHKKQQKRTEKNEKCMTSIETE